MQVYRLFTKKITIMLGILIFGLLAVPSVSADNTMIEGYKKPEVCLTSNIRCILKKRGNTKYWCLKSSIQRNLDARRTTTPIKKTVRENLGHCAKIIPIRE